MIDIGKLPNLRRLIVPDEGYTLVDMDLERADLYVVAADSGCKLLMQRLRTEDVHTRHALDFLGQARKYERDLMKKLSHAADYLVGVGTASVQTGLPQSKIREFLAYWEATYPEIRSVDANGARSPTCWHSRIAEQVARTRTVTNKFGYRKMFYGRLDQCLPEAVAWIPQSTVGLVINKALDTICQGLESSDRVKGLIQPLLQVHDSLTLQVWTPQLGDCIQWLRAASLIPIPYDPPLIIPVSFKTSDKNWGDVADYKEAACQ